MTVIAANLAAMLKRLIPIAQHQEYPEGDSVEVREAVTMLRSYEAQPTWHRETGWLVERDDRTQSPAWRMLELGMPVWTTDSLKAIRFARREDAEAFAAEDESAWRATEHSWGGLNPSAGESRGP